MFVHLRIGGGRAAEREATLTVGSAGNPVYLYASTVRDAPDERRGQAALIFPTRKEARRFARALLEQACDSCGGTGMIAGVTCRHLEPS